MPEHPETTEVDFQNQTPSYHRRNGNPCESDTGFQKIPDKPKRKKTRIKKFPESIWQGDSPNQGHYRRGPRKSWNR